MSDGKTNFLKELSEVHLQWFADPDPQMNFEDEFVSDETGEEPEEEGPEVVVLGPGEEAPKEDEGEEEVDPQVAALQQEIESLRERTRDQTSLGEVIGQQIAQAVNLQAPQPSAPEQAPGESDEDFWKRFDDEVFKPGRAKPLIQEAIFRTAGPAFNQVVGATVEQSKKLLQLDPKEGEIFNRFEKEIEAERERLPQAQKNDPRIYNTLLQNVKGRHPELQEEEFQRRVDEAVAAALKDQGVAGKAAPSSKPTYTEAGGVRTSAGPTKKRIYVKPEDKDAAVRMGLDISEYMKITYGGSR